MRVYPVDVGVKEVRYVRGVRSVSVGEIVRNVMLRGVIGKTRVWQPRRTGVVTRVYYRSGLVMFLVSTLDGRAVAGRRFRTDGVEIWVSPPLRLPRELVVYYSNVVRREAFEVVIELKVLPLVELIGRLWSSVTGTSAEKLVSVYVEMRKRGLPVPVRWIAELVGADYNSEEAEEKVRDAKLFTVPPDPDLSVRTLVELGVPEHVASKVPTCFEAGWTIGKLAGCLGALGLPYEVIKGLLGASEQTVKARAPRYTEV